MQNVLNIGSRREVLWDDYLIDTKRTTAEKRLHHPVKREKVMQLDAPWEGSSFFFGNILKDGDTLRMYYHGGCNFAYRDKLPPDARERELGLVSTCLAQSRDGIHWERPKLGVFDFYGLRDNNLVLTPHKSDGYDANPNGCSMFVMKDPNADCPPDELYKAVHGTWNNGVHELKYLASADGVHFRFMRTLYSAPMYFDSLNTLHYSTERKKYYCYFRGWHKSSDLPGNEALPETYDHTRNICYMESEDFITWSDPKRIEFGENAPDFHMYTNVIQPYYRAPHITVGFPSRYIERTEWTDNYEQLGGKAARLDRMERYNQPRFGYAVTDTLFMLSRDGEHFDRTDEAFIRPDIENDWGWGYGECYMSTGLFEVPSDLPGGFPELSFLLPTRNLLADADSVWLYRYAIRPDGFISRSAGYEEKILTTKPFIFTGDTFTLNFETSAAGHVFVEFLDKTGRPLEGYRSCELFGNTIDRKVGFRNDLKKLNNIPVKLRFTLCDADVYSFQFC